MSLTEVEQQIIIVVEDDGEGLLDAHEPVDIFGWRRTYIGSATPSRKYGTITAHKSGFWNVPDSSGRIRCLAPGAQTRP